MSRELILRLGVELGAGRSIALDAELTLDAASTFAVRDASGHDYGIVATLSDLENVDGEIWGEITFIEGHDRSAFGPVALEFDQMRWNGPGHVGECSMSLAAGRVRGASVRRLEVS